MDGRGQGIAVFLAALHLPRPQLPGAVSEETGVAVGHEANSSELPGN